MDNKQPSVRFTTRAMESGDFRQDTEYNGALACIINPGKEAQNVLGNELSYSRLFAYCFRRFGSPNAPSDPDKEIAAYRLITPVPDLFLVISLKPTHSTSLLFGYFMSNALYEKLLDEYKDRSTQFHDGFLAWRKKTNNPLPSDSSQVFDFSEQSKLTSKLLPQYIAQGGTSYENIPLGPATDEVLAALRATLEDLKTPVDVRDQIFSAINDDSGDLETEEIYVAERHPAAGCYIPAELVKTPDLYFSLLAKLEILGEGCLESGIRALVKT